MPITRNRVFLFLVSLLFLDSCSPTILPQPSSGHEPQIVTPLYDELWSMENIYTIQMSDSSSLAAYSGVVCFDGALKNNENFKIHCLRTLTGDMLWQRDPCSSTNIMVVPDGIYVACSGMAGVIKYDMKGDELWSRHFWESGISYMQVVDDQVQIFPDPEKLIILNAQGGNIVTKSSNKQSMVFYTKTITFIENIGIEAVDNVTGKILWYVETDHPVELPPVFLSDRIYLVSGNGLGRVYAIDRATGSLLWKTEDNIISNIAYSETNQTIYLLTRNGQLLSINRDSGQQVVVANFSSTPFILNGEDIVGGYELAFDDTNQILFVMLGDSRQLFAFQIQ